MFDIIWQDAALMGCNLAFLIALIPSIIGNDKPAKSTSLMTALALTLYTFTYSTLDLAFTTFVVAISAVAWWILYFQKR